MEILVAPQWITLEGSEVVVPETDHDFSRYDAYVGTGVTEIPVLYLAGRDGQKVTQALELQPPRTDVGQSAYEQRPNFGDYFAQGDFTGGAGQRFYHRANRDETKFYESEGFDVSERGKLRHLNTVAIDGTFSDPHSLVQYDGLPFLIDGVDVYRGDGDFPAAVWTAEDPHDGEGDVAALSLAAGGDNLYAALGVNGVHVRSSGGAWTHFQPDGVGDLDVGTATLVAWAKDRLMVVGQAGRAIYEVVADSTPTAIETLPPGWTITSIFEAGAFIMATAENRDQGASSIQAYGIDESTLAIVKKANTLAPRGDILQSGRGYLGRLFVGGGRQNSGGGYDPILYEGIVGDTGEVQLVLVSESEGATSDVSVSCFEFLPASVIFGWSPDGRTGLGSYGLAQNAFTNHLKVDATEKRVTSVLLYKGRLVFTVKSTDLYYEELDSPVATATLVSSVADWNTAGTKTWDMFEVRHSALGVGESVTVEYTSVDPDEEDWLTALTSELEGSVSAEERVEDLRSSQLAVRLTSTAYQTNSPEVIAFSVRSTPSPANVEWLIARTIRILDRDRKNTRAEMIHSDPRDIRDQLEGLAYRWITLYEPGTTWVAYVQSIAYVEPGISPVQETGGTPEREAYYLELRMVGRRS